MSDFVNSIEGMAFRLERLGARGASMDVDEQHGSHRIIMAPQDNEFCTGMVAKAA